LVELINGSESEGFLGNFGTFNTLTNLLKPVANEIKVDQNTLLHLKGIALVCVNVDIFEPLPGSLVIYFEGRTIKIPLIYEQLPDVYALCGSKDHEIETCLMLSAQAKKELIIEKFRGIRGICYSSSLFY